MRYDVGKVTTNWLLIAVMLGIFYSLPMQAGETVEAYIEHSRRGYAWFLAGLVAGPVALAAFMATMFGLVACRGAAARLESGHLVFPGFFLRIPVDQITTVEKGPIPGSMVLGWSNSRRRVIGLTTCRGSPSAIRTELATVLKKRGAPLQAVGATSG